MLLRLSASAGQSAACVGSTRYRRMEFFLGRRRACGACQRPVVNGKQMYVEYQIPAQVRHPYPIVPSRGGGQGLDWLLTPDGALAGRRICQEGHKVYIVDRPRHGRSPFHPELQGPVSGAASELLRVHLRGLFTPQERRGRTMPTPAAQSMAGSAMWEHRTGAARGVQGDRSSRTRSYQTVWRERGAMLLDKSVRRSS